MNNENQKFFLYTRKSTHVGDKQVRSIKDQIEVLRTFVKRERLEIVDVFVEKQSAKIPGRPVFSKMMRRIKKEKPSAFRRGTRIGWHAILWTAVGLSSSWKP
ncbi:recombinase family protein [Candidatus Parcubacteria bacterium]|nr:MAG: recombinase family protein [Candidatus Parcubacteria bacterium]GIW69119.1 MAG: hypothetical protein KatS3mg100_613 [Candidatus Parcubacteria bacterium]